MILPDSGSEIPIPKDASTWGFLIVIVGFLLRELWGYFKKHESHDKQQITAALNANAQHLAGIASKLEGMRERVDAKFEALGREFAHQFRELQDRIAENDGTMAVIQSRLDRAEQEIGILREEKHKVREDATRAIAEAISRLTKQA